MADLSPTQVASQSGLSTSAVYKAIRREELPARYAHARRLLISQRDVYLWLAARESQAADDSSGAMNA